MMHTVAAYRCRLRVAIRFFKYTHTHSSLSTGSYQPFGATFIAYVVHRSPHLFWRAETTGWVHTYKF